MSGRTEHKHRHELIKQYSIDALICARCGLRKKSNHLHHIDPLYIGGDNDVYNLIPLCAGCHNELDYYAALGFTLAEFLTTPSLFAIAQGIRGKKGGDFSTVAIELHKIERMGNALKAGTKRKIEIYLKEYIRRNNIFSQYLYAHTDIKLDNRGIIWYNIDNTKYIETNDSDNMSMLSVFTQLERDTITERLVGGRKTKAKTGGYSGGNSAIGYSRERGVKSLLVDEDKAATVKRVFDLKGEGLKLQQIADQLNAEGHTTKQGAQFSPTQVMRILKRRELYEGIYTYSGITADGLHAAIILNNQRGAISPAISILFKEV